MANTNVIFVAIFFQIKKTESVKTKQNVALNFRLPASPQAFLFLCVAHCHSLTLLLTLRPGCCPQAPLHHLLRPAQDLHAPRPLLPLCRPLLLLG